jgi:hypothetical protein
MNQKESAVSTVKKENSKVYIEGVRQVSWGTGEMCEFASSLLSAICTLGGCAPYHYILGASGVAFRFTLNPGEWDFTNYGIREVSADPYEPIRRAIQAAGYACTVCEASSKQADAATIMSSIDRGVPVLAFRVVGPSDCCIITGYDEGGEVLLGWSTFQDIPDDHNIPHDVTGYFRKPGWHDNLPGYILIGAQVGRPPLHNVYLDAVKWAVHLMRTPRMGSKRTGFEGLSVWAEEMTQEQYFPAGDEQVLGQRYVSTTINITMLRDHCSAEPFLRQAAEEVLDFQPELWLAADCYRDVKHCREEMDDLISDNFSAKAMQAIADPEIRRAFAGKILQIRDVEEEAIGHLEHLLERCG